MKFVDFLWKVIGNSDSGSFNISNEGPYIFFILIKTKFGYYRSRSGGNLLSTHSMNTFKTNSFDIFLWDAHLDHEKKRDGVRVDHKKKRDGVRADHKKKSDGVRFDHVKKS